MKFSILLSSLSKQNHHKRIQVSVSKNHTTSSLSHLKTEQTEWISEPNTSFLKSPTLSHCLDFGIQSLVLTENHQVDLCQFWISVQDASHRFGGDSCTDPELICDSVASLG